MGDDMSYGLNSLNSGYIRDDMVVSQNEGTLI